MTDTQKSSKAPTIQTYLIAAAVLLALPAISYIVGAFNVPKPMNLTKTRSAVDRKAMQGDILLSKVPDNVVKPMHANMEDKIEILGFSTNKKKAIQGSKVELTFYFKALSAMDQDWQIFGHIDGANNVYRIHADHFPAGGKYTTDLWKKGEIIADHYSKYIPLDAPNGVYDVWIGFYLADRRLKLKNASEVTSDGHNRIKLGQIHIGP